MCMFNLRWISFLAVFLCFFCLPNKNREKAPEERETEFIDSKAPQMFWEKKVMGG